MMGKKVLVLGLMLLSLIGFGEGHASKEKNIGGEIWLTTSDQQYLFKQRTLLSLDTRNDELTTIIISAEETFQQMDGFGFTLTGGSARLINSMGEMERNALLNNLFGTSADDIGISYLRISIGASDLSDSVFTYDDMPKGSVDPELSFFSIKPELAHLVPVLKSIKAIYPELKIMGSPWTAPAWMKDNGSMIGGSLLKKYYSNYAQYFVKYIKAMAEQGISIDAITVQNEPLHPGNNPSMYMLADDQAEFVKNHLGPAFQKNNLTTKIIIYDHNADRPDYPISVLNDPKAAKYIDGSAFHLYAGDVKALSQVHEAHPDKHLYFTEQWIGGPADFGGDLNWHIENLIIGASRNWCKTVLEWNLAADQHYKPHTDRGGCTRCLGAVTINGNEVSKNPAYYIIAHAAKFVRPGSYRIASNVPAHLPNVAFLTPNNDVVLIVLNSGNDVRSFNIRFNDKQFTAQLPSKAVATYFIRN